MYKSILQAVAVCGFLSLPQALCADQHFDGCTSPGRSCTVTNGPEAATSKGYPGTCVSAGHNGLFCMPAY